ncbi:MAG: lipopolysaccharide kinase InaA family protein [Planctomycetota bacterium]|jgi:tRNA A-37 threonylcarbamoyl transferase component Bud32
MASPLHPLTSFEGKGGLLWRSVEDEAAWVREVIASDPDGVEKLPGAEVVKRNPVRSVIRVPREGREAMYIKRFAVGGPLSRMKYLFLPSRAEAEWRASRGMREAGIPAAETVAVAELRTSGILRDAMLVVREVPRCMELVPYLFDRFPGIGPWTGKEASARRDLLGRLGALLRRVHDEGFIHPDLHGGNVLVRRGEEPPSVTIIDLHSVTRRAVVAPGIREEDLAKLMHSMITATSHADRGRVLRAYMGERSALAPGRALRRIEARIASLEEARVRSRTRSRKLLHRTGRFNVSRRKGGRMVYLRSWGTTPFDAALDQHREIAASGAPVDGETVLKRGGRSTVTRVNVEGPNGPVDLVVKETMVRGGGDVWKNLLRRPRAVRGWLHGNGLWHRHVDVAEPRALLATGRWPMLRESFLVMEAIEGGERLDLRGLRLWGHGPLDTAARADKRRDVERFGRFVGELHARGVYHGDLKAVNIFVRMKHGMRSFCLVDYDHVVFGSGLVSFRRRIKNLAQLSASVGTYVSRADRLRFFAAYASQVKGAWAERKRVNDEVREACAQKIVVVREPIE